MAASNLTKRLISAGITANTDGLLRDLVARRMYQAAIGTIDAAVEKRIAEANFLEGFKRELQEQIFEDQEV